MGRCLWARPTWGGLQLLEPEGAKLLEGRLWVDRMPTSTRDMVGKFVVVNSVDHGPFGVAERGSVWRHRTEVFQWSRSGDALKVYLPQDRKRATFQVRTWRCKDAPEPFELCLELRRDGKTKRLYSRHDWFVHPRPGGGIVGDDLPAVLRWQPEERDEDEETSSLGELFPAAL